MEAKPTVMRPKNKIKDDMIADFEADNVDNV